jgi:hypothetical protein
MRSVSLFSRCKNTKRARTELGASRLQQAADILGVAVPFFFEGAVGGAYKADGSAPSPAYIDDFVTTSDGLRLMKAFMRIPKPAVRHHIVALVKEIAGGD